VRSGDGGIRKPEYVDGPSFCRIHCWLKLKNRSYSQVEGRHELLTRKEIPKKLT
jgi:hypothetical protein